MSNGGLLNPIPDDEDPAAAVGGRGRGGRGGDFGERLARVETHLEHVATKADVEALKTALVDAINQKHSVMLQWQIGIVVAAAVIMIVATVSAMLGGSS